MGTWERYAQGRTIIGQGTSDQTFAADATGGASNVTLTTAQMPNHKHSGPSHTHTVNSHSHSIPSHAHGVYIHGVQSASSNVGYGQSVFVASGSIGNNTSGDLTGTWSGNTGNASPNTGSAGTGDTGNAGNGNSHNNLPPYVVTYIWKRTA